MRGLKLLKEFQEHYFFELDEEDNLNVIEKELIALKIIVKKANIRLFRSGNLFYFKTTNNYYCISEDKYNLLREVLYGRYETKR